MALRVHCDRGCECHQTDHGVHILEHPVVRVCEVVLGKKANVCLSSAVLEIRNATSLELTLSTDDAYGPAMRISR